MIMFGKGLFTRVVAGSLAGLLAVGGLSGCAKQETQAEQNIRALKEAGLIVDKPKRKGTVEEYDQAYQKLADSRDALVNLVEEARRLKTACAEQEKKISMTISACRRVLTFEPSTRIDKKTSTEGKNPEQLGSMLDTVKNQQAKIDYGTKTLQDEMDEARQEMESLNF